jgi:hypothetical protein
MEDRPLEKTRIMGMDELPTKVDAPQPEHIEQSPSHSLTKTAFIVVMLLMGVLSLVMFGAVLGRITSNPAPPPETAIVRAPEEADLTSESEADADNICPLERTVAVLGIESLDFDDELAINLTQELRISCGSQPGWMTSRTRASIIQMTLVFQCDPRTMACLRQIAEELEADRLIFGYVQRADPLSAQSPILYRYELFSYDVEENDIVAIIEGESMLDESQQERYEISEAVAPELLQ